MKSLGLTLACLASAITYNLIGWMPISAQQATSSPEATQEAEKKLVRYECLQDGNTFITIAHTPRGPIEMVTWKSKYFGPQWTPERRCNAVTERFQVFSDAEKLKFVSYGRLNAYKVLCVSEQSGKCMSDSLLLTLEPKDNPVRVLTSLFNYETMLVRGRKTVISIEELLQTRPPRSELPQSSETQPDIP